MKRILYNLYIPRTIDPSKTGISESPIIIGCQKLLQITFMYVIYQMW